MSTGGIIKEEKHFNCSLCSVCHSQNPVRVYCIGCPGPMCSPCKDKHDKNARNKSHVSVPADESIIPYLVCQTHKKYIEAFCISCSETVCANCIIDTHGEHHVSEFQLQQDDTLLKLEQDKGLAEENIDDEMTVLKRNRFFFNREMDVALDDVKTHHKWLIETLNQHFQSCCDEINKHRDDMNNNMEICKRQLKQAKEDVKTTFEQTSRWRKPIKQLPSLQVSDIQQLSEDLKKRVELASKYPKTTETASVKFEPNTNYTRSDFGEIVTLNAAKEVSNTSDVIDVAFLPSGDVIVSRENSNILVLSGKTFEPVIHHNLPKEWVARKIEVSSTGDVIVDHQLSGQMAVWTKKGSKWTKEVCDGIFNDSKWTERSFGGAYISNFALSKNNNIVLNITNRICFHTLRFEKFREFDTKGDIYALTVDNNNRIVVCDISGVTVYTDSGTEIFSFTDCDGTEPNCVCTDANDNIIIGDELTNDVVMYNKEGRFVRRLVQCTSKPESVACYKDKILAVVTAECELTLYEYS